MKPHRAAPFVAAPHRLWLRHRLALFGGILALCFSIGTAGTLMNLTYFAHASDALATGIFFTGSALACALFGIAQSLVLHGYPKWVWLQAGVFMVYFLAVIPTALYSPDRTLFTLALLSPLIGMLCLNSKRQREMRRTMVDMRQLRTNQTRTPHARHP
ncbi:hypothetical protein [Pseudomonas poae]|uniref:hypothetical protein n=1 Tax=Pseudomonas poae TaxID=200451 RepID=UPI000CFDC7B6|nr:hypothetical protein [Pseudomonas poae]PRA21883.1 hypothetical protein CQZ97_27385 [Pseudomonas poae]